MAQVKKGGLGRGLGALLKGVDVDTPAPESTVDQSPAPQATQKSDKSSIAGKPETTDKPSTEQPALPGDAVVEVPVEQITRGTYQPRRHFDDEALQELADSIAAQGLIQPIILRKRAGGFELIAGERRWRAAKLIGLDVIPAIIREMTDGAVAAVTLIENIQREDLNPIERATAFQRLSTNHSLTQAQLAERMGLDRSTVTNLLRLLKLAPEVQAFVSQGTLSMSQARSIASVDDHQQQIQLAETAIRKAWSVRETEDAVRRANAAAADGPPLPEKPAAPRAAYLADLERQIAEQLSTKVKLKAGRKKGSGTIAIDFYSIDEFDQLMSRLGVNTG